jgi:prevent-host-death family protein
VINRVGIRELKDTLSAVLHRVREGEPIEVTDNGRPIVLMVPIRSASVTERLIDQGILALAPDADAAWPDPEPTPPGQRPMSEIVSEMRADERCRRRWVYIDTSAFVQLCWREPESQALLAHLGGRPLVSSVVLQVEAVRAAMRRSPADVSIAQRMLRRVSRMTLAGAAVGLAATMHPEVRSLDAIHIASAKLLDADLDELVTYDERMRQAALAQGLTVHSPG